MPYGVGLGGVLAANLAAAHPELPALIVDQPRPGAYYQAVDAQQSRLLPMHLLVRDRFDLGTALAGVHQPKLLFANSPFGAKGTHGDPQAGFLRGVGDPKLTVTFDGPPAEDQYLSALHRFLDEYVR